MNHAKILSAYLDRLTLSQLESLVEVRKQSLHAAMNLGNNAQIEAHETEVITTRHVLAGMPFGNLDAIERIIKEAL